MLFLKQSTAVTVKIGPFLDDSDGKTAETALTIAQADVRLSKNGGNIAQKNESTSCTHDELGVYDCPLDTTDTNTLGRLQLWVAESGALPVWHEFMVVTANVYDTLCSTDLFQTDLTQIGGVAQSATDLKDFADAGYDPATNKVQGLVLADTTTDVTNDVGITQAGADKAWSTTTRALTDKTGFSLSASGIDAIIDEVVEGTLTLRQAVRIYLAALGGKSSGGGTNTLTFRDNADSKARITATVDSDGNRTAVTLDGT